MKSIHATKFRQWANRVLKDYMISLPSLNKLLDVKSILEIHVVK